MDTLNVVETPTSITVSNLVMETTSDGKTLTTVFPEINITDDDYGVTITMDGTIVGADTAGQSFGLDLSGAALFLEDTTDLGIIGPFSILYEGPLALDLSVAEDDEFYQVAVDSENLSIDIPQGDENGTGTAHVLMEDTRISYIGDFKQKSDEKSMRGEYTSQYGAMALDLEITDIAKFYTGDPVTAISNGANLFLETTQQPGSSKMKTDDGLSVSTNWAETDTQISLDREGFKYSFDMGEMDIDAQNKTENKNMKASFEGASGNLLVPMFANGQEQKAKLSIKANDLIIDAQGNDIPAEVKPYLGKSMSLDIQTQADMTLENDIFPKSQKSNPEDVISAGTITGAQVEKLLVEFGDSSLEGTGDILFTGTNMVDIQPKSGTADVAMKGVEAILDIAVMSGAMGEQNKTMTMMMLRGMAKPGDVSTLNYTLKLNEDGTTTLNGNPL